MALSPVRRVAFSVSLANIPGLTSFPVSFEAEYNSYRSH